MAPQVGLEPTTLRLTAECSAIELLRNMGSGGDLLSRAVTSQVPSALKGLTSVFGMGTGVTPSLSPPEWVNEFTRFSAFWAPYRYSVTEQSSFSSSVQLLTSRVPICSGFPSRFQPVPSQSPCASAMFCAPHSDNRIAFRDSIQSTDSLFSN